MSFNDAYALIQRCKDVIDDDNVRRDMFLKSATAASLVAEEAARVYPEASHKPLDLYYDRVGLDGHTFKSKFKSLRQQRKVFQLIKAGLVPSRRSGALGNSIMGQGRVEGRYILILIGT